jgi:uncharacterized protein YuzE
MVDYDKDSDMLYIRLKSGGSVESEEIADGVVVDYGVNGDIVGVEIENAAQKMGLKASGQKLGQ